jgi:hypothetical protein
MVTNDSGLRFRCPILHRPKAASYIGPIAVRGAVIEPPLCGPLETLGAVVCLAFAYSSNLGRNIPTLNLSCRSARNRLEQVDDFGTFEIGE